MATNHPKPIPPLEITDIARFWSHVEVRGPDECWPWHGKSTADGRGALYISGRLIAAPRLAMAIQGQGDPYPYFALHTCDFPPCCNGSHLKRGGHVENTADRVARGHTTKGKPMISTRGSANPAAKLTEEMVREIRAHYSGRRGEVSAFSREFNVSRRLIYTVVQRIGWKHV